MKLGLKRGWFVSTWTTLTRFNTAREAFAYWRSLSPAANAAIVRECECGCNQPAARSTGVHSLRRSNRPVALVKADAFGVAANDCASKEASSCVG